MLEGAIMAFLTVGANGTTKHRRHSKKSKATEFPQRVSGMVYLIKMVLDEDTTVVKIGITTRRSIVERLAENVIGFFNTYRYIPRTTVKKYSRTPYYREIESHLHKVYKEDNYKFDKKFDGSTEYFYLRDEKALIEYYTKVMKDPLDYITPNEATVEKQKKVEEAYVGNEVADSINDIEPVSI